MSRSPLAAATVGGMQPTTQDYEIRVTGMVPTDLLDEISGLGGVSVDSSTTLVCQLEDSAELHGLLARIASRGLDVVELRVLPAEATHLEG